MELSSQLPAPADLPKSPRFPLDMWVLDAKGFLGQNVSEILL
jgi:hypothetical protein